MFVYYTQDKIKLPSADLVACGITKESFLQRTVIAQLIDMAINAMPFLVDLL